MTTTHDDRPAAGDDLAADPVLQAALAICERAVHLIRTTDPVAVELYQLGYRAGIEEGERRAAERAERSAAVFLDYLRTDSAATPRPVPPLETDTTTTNERRGTE